MATEFRPLNDNEKHALDRAIDKGEAGELASFGVPSLSVSYERLSGGFCVCVILTQTKQGRGKPPLQILFRGASRQSSKDKPNRLKGDMLAFNRAVRDSQPVSI